MENPAKSVIATQDGSLIFEFLQEGVPHAPLQEKHSIKVQTSTYPVESRQTITDHAIINPLTLNMKGIVSDLYQPRKYTTLDIDQIAGIDRDRTPDKVLLSQL